MDINTTPILLFAIGILLLGVWLFRTQSDAEGHALGGPIQSYEWIYQAYTEERRIAAALRADVRVLWEYALYLYRQLVQCDPKLTIAPFPVLQANGREGGVLPSVAELRHILEGRFSRDEASDFAFDLKVDIEGHNNPDAIVRAVLAHYERRNALGNVVAWLAQRRPDIKL